MDLREAIEIRHSVRQYLPKQIEKEKADILREKLDELNSVSGLHMQLILDEPKAFSSGMAKYGSFSGVSNYIVVIGKRGRDLDEKAGYYGERAVLEAQILGLNTCWAGLTYRKVRKAYKRSRGEKLVVVIALGYGKTQGKNHRSKDMHEVARIGSYVPTWYVDGVEAALKAPTAMNQQKFHFEREKNKVRIKAGKGFYTKVDMGIAKLHFEIGSGMDNTVWI